MQFEYDRFFIGGSWQSPHSSATIAVHSASTEKYIGRVPQADDTDVDASVQAARVAFDDPSGWASWEPQKRAAILRRFADELDRRSDDTAGFVSMQNGMPISLARRFEGQFPARYLRYYADLIEDQEEYELRPGITGADTKIYRYPVGVVAAIVPWNVPQAITFLKVAPALAAGCTVVLKPAEETVLDAFLMAEAAEDAGFPPGVINVVAGGRDVGASLVSHPAIDKVTFTGSTAAGRAIAETCGRLLRPVTLELGGKSAAVVLDDADLSDSRADFFGVTFLNNGQVCWLNTRVLAPKSRYDEVVEFVTSLGATARIGDPLDDDTAVGPLVSAAQRDRVESYIDRGVADGAKLTTGGARPGQFDRGYFLEPTVFADVDNRSAIAQEEIFGPVISIIRYDGDDDAVAIANDSPYGLGGSVWTSDAERGEHVAKRIHTGTIGLNGYSNDPAAPFGGVKSSGLGRERGPEGLYAFQWIKAVFL